MKYLDDIIFGYRIGCEVNKEIISGYDMFEEDTPLRVKLNRKSYRLSSESNNNISTFLGFIAGTATGIKGYIEFYIRLKYRNDYQKSSKNL